MTHIKKALYFQGECFHFQFVLHFSQVHDHLVSSLQVFIDNVNYLQLWQPVGNQSNRNKVLGAAPHTSL